MKIVIFLIFLALSVPALANSVLGTWNTCDIDSDGNESEQYVTFGKNNVMFEAFFFNKPGKTPCGGKYQMTIGMYWHYELVGRVLKKTSFSTYLIIHDPHFITNANKNKVCGKSDWKLEEKVDCTDDKYLKSEVGRGRKSSYEFSVAGEELQLTENGNTSIYKKDNE